LSSEKCSVEMRSGTCGRDVVRTGKCIFHLDNKTQAETELFKREFLSYVAASLEDSRLQIVDCTSFVFPPVVILLSTKDQPKTFGKSIVFKRVQIQSWLVFSDATFEADSLADFSGAIFKGNSRVDFSRAIFKGDSLAYFSRAIFKENSRVDFWDAIFKGGSRADFSGAIFEGNSRVDFSRAIFKGDSLADFSRAIFKGDSLAYFSGATFENDAKTDFSHARLKDKVELDLRDAILQRLDFSYFSIEETAKVRLGSVHRPDAQDLSRASFLHTDVRLIDFGNVVWGRKPPGSIADEHSIKYEGGPSYEDVVTLYRLLRQNYEQKLRYSDAADFFVREMELLRTQPRYFGKKPAIDWSFDDLRILYTLKNRVVWSMRVGLRLLRGLISIPAVYYVLAKYGESYRRVIAWSLASVVLIYPIFFSLLRRFYIALRTHSHAVSLENILLQYPEEVNRGFRLFFQVFELPTLDLFDLAFRLWSGLLLAVLYISLRRKLERKPALT